MCGIVGVLARRPAAALIVESLRRLEYRGYDSAGVATVDGDTIRMRRAVGKLDALVEKLASKPLAGAAGIGHTRWATHGAVTEANAHPHLADGVAVVHNGIIENYREIRAELEAAGRVFFSETDSEVAAHLCAANLASGLSPVDAAARTFSRLRGAFSLAMLFDVADDLLVCARNGPPLAVGYGDGEMYVASDALALAPLSSDIAYLEDGDWAAVTRAGAHIFDAANLPVTRVRRRLALDPARVGKNGHRHFMAKEIFEQPDVARRCLAAATGPDGQVLSPVGGLDWSGLSRVTLVACGTAYYACLAARWWLETTARIHADADTASEFRYREPPLPEGGVAIFVSQSGETADTLAAMRYARSQGQTTVAIVNVETSTMAREADIVAPLMAGPEIGVASTKAFVAQLTCLALIAVAAGRARGVLDAKAECALMAEMSLLPERIEDMLALEPSVARLAQVLARRSNVLYVGRGPMSVVALEGALKLKELAYIHAEGYAAGELKHGPIALVDERTPTVAIAPMDRLFEKTLSNLSEVSARKGPVILFTDIEGSSVAGQEGWARLVAPKTHPFIAPIVFTVPMQLLAYHTALARGTDVDQPRNLAKSVTVE